MYKLYAIVSASAIKDMKGNRGRMVTQGGGHAFLHAFWDATDRFPEAASAYRNQDSAFKLTLVVDDADALKILHEKYKNVAGTSLVEERGTKADGTINESVKGVTALGIGPIHVDLIGDDLKGLKSFL